MGKRSLSVGCSRIAPCQDETQTQKTSVTLSISDTTSMPLVDEETRRVLLKKTWCHGQSILPPYSIFLLFRWFGAGHSSLSFLLGAFILPVWSWFSYRVVAIDSCGGKLPYRNVCVFGVVSMMVHLSIFLSVLSDDLSGAGNMLMLVASGLFFVETGAFLLVVTAFRNEIANGAEGPLRSGASLC